MENNPNVTAKPSFKTDRSMPMYFLLSFITCGIYGIYFMTKFTDDLNTIATKRDGLKTMHYCLMIFYSVRIDAGDLPSCLVPQDVPTSR